MLAAVLGLHAIRDRPVAINGKIEIRPVCSVFGSSVVECSLMFATDDVSRFNIRSSSSRRTRGSYFPCQGSLQFESHFELNRPNPCFRLKNTSRTRDGCCWFNPGVDVCHRTCFLSWDIEASPCRLIYSSLDFLVPLLYFLKKIRVADPMLSTKTRQE
jgi:hypothetical protein